MICDLCNQDRTAVVRVDTWSVCSECSANGPLQSALQARADLESLKKAVKATTARDIEGRTLQRFAEDRIKAAQGELDSAIQALIPVVAKSAEAKVKAFQALEQLGAFEQTYPHLTKDETEPPTPP